MVLTTSIVDQGFFSFRIKVTVSVILTILGGILICAFINFEQDRGILIFSTAVAGGVATIYAAFYMALTLRCNIQILRAHILISDYSFYGILFQGVILIGQMV